MKTKGLALLVLALILLAAPGLQGIVKAAEPDMSGVWEGKLEVQGTALRIVFHVAKNGDGSYKVTMDSPDQGAKGIPVSKLTVVNGVARFEISLAQAVFEGKLSADGREIMGTWKQGLVALPLTVEKKEVASDTGRPQEPKRPYPYREEEVTYMNEIDNVKLAGTLTIPQGKGPFPAVILITGSGSQDRDETLMGHKPFLVIADYLTRQGIAVLRVDDRGVGGSTGSPLTATTADFVKDVLAGVNYLTKHPEINAKKIGLIGHSEGGLIAPMVAVETSDVAFIVLMAGPGMSGSDVILSQIELINRAAGTSEKDIQNALAMQKQYNRVIVEVKDDKEAKAQLTALLKSYFDNASEEEKQAVVQAAGSMDNYINATVANALLPWNRFFFAFDPGPTLRKVQCPVLAINGSKDLQVDAKPNLAGIEKALKEGGNRDMTIIELPGLNHLFQTANTGSPAEYGSINETIAPSVLKLMGDWILQRVK